MRSALKRAPSEWKRFCERKQKTNQIEKNGNSILQCEIQRIVEINYQIIQITINTGDRARYNESHSDSARITKLGE